MRVLLTEKLQTESFFIFLFVNKWKFLEINENSVIARKGLKTWMFHVARNGHASGIRKLMGNFVKKDIERLI